MSAAAQDRSGTTATRTATATGPTLRSSTRSARGPVLVVVALVVVSAIVGVLSLRPSGRLDPDAFDPAGSRAVAELLRGGGVDVVRVGTVEQARERVDQTAVLVLPAPQGLADAELAQLAALPGSLLVVEPSADALEALDLPARPAGTVAVEPRRPACEVEAVARAGDAELGGTTYEPTTGTAAIGCYGARGDATLLVLPEQQAVLLGTGTPLTNDRLDERGNAALVLGLLGAGGDVVWLVPEVGRAVPQGDQRPLTSLVPAGLLLGVLQVAVAAALLGLWRGRRLGRVVEEPLPVVVRAAEAVEGRGRLYQAARARGPAAQALRAGTGDRAAVLLGLSPTDRESLAGRVGERTGRDPGDVAALLYGAPPVDDPALVRLAEGLRALERDLTGPAQRRAARPAGTGRDDGPPADAPPDDRRPPDDRGADRP